MALSTDGRTIVSASLDSTLKVWDVASGACRATYPQVSAEAQVAWRSVDRLDESHRLSTAGGLLQAPLVLLLKAGQTDANAAIAGSLIASGNLDRAYGSLAGDKVLAFTANGEAHWFRIRFLDGA